jgi:small subunit ribosomal protein S4
MSRYRNAKLRVIRRLGELPGLTSKVPKKSYPPGVHGPSKDEKKSSISEYAIRLQEKQKLRFNYGISEKQLLNYVKKAKRLPGATGTIILQLLEMRLDSIIFQLGFANTIAAARQIVSHGHIKVNGKKLNIPSFQCKPNDVISIVDKKQSKNLISKNIETTNRHSRLKSHLDYNDQMKQGKVINMVDTKDIDLNINELLIVEFYSKK